MKLFFQIVGFLLIIFFLPYLYLSLGNYKKDFVNSLVEEINTEISFPLEVDIGTLERVEASCNNNDCLNYIYKTTPEEFDKENFSKYILIDRFTSSDIDFVYKLKHYEVTCFFSYYHETEVGDTLLHWVSISPHDW